MAVVACDISEHNPLVDDTYPHPWLILRACFGGGYTDQHVAHNLAWAIAARASGRLQGFTVYVVYLPGQNAGILAHLDKLGVPRDCPVMIDAEKWGGQSYQINGDHSTEINALAASLRARQGGRSDLAWGYGNRGPDLEVWPNKPSWVGWIVASYGGSKPDVTGMAGWQYTNGQYTVAGLPSSSAPFGQCDHNVLYQLPEADMSLTAAQAAQLADAAKFATAACARAQSLQAVVATQSTALADAVTRIADLQSNLAALQAQVSAQPTVQPTDVPVTISGTGTAHIGSTS